MKNTSHKREVEMRESKSKKSKRHTQYERKGLPGFGILHFHSLSSLLLCCALGIGPPTLDLQNLLDSNVNSKMAVVQSKPPRAYHEPEERKKAAGNQSKEEES